ncbi:MAG: dienelactone hydrolase family protein, partial [Verrucomicrobiota bacterium]
MSTAAGETLPPLTGDAAPTTYEAMWAGFDPRTEPLEIEVLKEWEEDGVTLKVLRYRIGVFKGKKAMMAGVYGYPQGGTKLPGLLQIHGGGQYADHKAVLANAKRGYATISISWAGRISAPGYRVSPDEVQLFWENKTDDPAYQLTTDWGALDAYHAPSKNGKDAFVTIPTASWTLDPVISPRNSSWFLCAVGARRALTFLEQQPEVDKDRLGVYGHSMGGKLTVLTTGADDRVKAAAPSCGGISDRYNPSELHRQTVGDSPSLQRIDCPTIFLSPANDFHGHINDLPAAIKEIKTPDWRVTCSPHLNHQDLPRNEVATLLWFDQHLKKSFTWPTTPVTELQLQTDRGIPSIRVKPDPSRQIQQVDVY